MSVGRKFLQVVAFVCTLIVGVASMAIIVTQTTWFKEWLRGFIIKQADDYVNGRLTIGRIDGNLFFGVEAEDIDITQNGQPVISLKDVGIDYSFLTFRHAEGKPDGEGRSTRLSAFHGNGSPMQLGEQFHHGEAKPGAFEST